MKLPITSFMGMDVVNMGGIQTQERGTIPFLIIDALPDNNGTLIRRPKFSENLLPGLNGISDLWRSAATGNVYCRSGNNLLLVDLDKQTHRTIKTIDQLEDHKVYYAYDIDRDYIGNVYWVGVFDTAGNEIEIPEPFADYGNTQTSIFRTKGTDSSTLDVPGIEKIFPMDHLVFGHGRLWGTVANRLYYSLPHAFALWSRFNQVMTFPSNITMVAPVHSGIWLGTEENLIWMAGNDPANFQMKVYSPRGIVKDSLVYASYIGELEHIPLWMTADGFIQGGGNDGRIIEVTKERIQCDPSKKVRATKYFYRGIECVSWSNINLKKE